VSKHSGREATGVKGGMRRTGCGRVVSMEHSKTMDAPDNGGAGEQLVTQKRIKKSEKGQHIKERFDEQQAWGLREHSNETRREEKDPKKRV